MSARSQVAVAAAKEGWLVTIGLTPTRPETGYGYIEATQLRIVETVDGIAYRAARFVEKPDLARATSYVESGRFLWNASMFVWSVQTFLEELALLLPELHAGVTRIAAAWDTPDRARVLAEVWPTLPATTIDNGVMEQAARVAVVPAEMGWSDVGDWHGLGELLDHDSHGFCGRGDLVQAGSRSQRRLVGDRPRDRAGRVGKHRRRRHPRRAADRRSGAGAGGPQCGVDAEGVDAGRRHLSGARSRPATLSAVPAVGSGCRAGPCSARPARVWSHRGGGEPAQ